MGGEGRPSLDELLSGVVDIDEQARADALLRHDALAKPPGSLGALESLGAQLAAIAGRCPAPVPRSPWLLLAAADHGVHAAGVSAWPQEVTAAVVDAACRGVAVSSVLAEAHGVTMTVLDVGLAHPVAEHPILVSARAGLGTRNLAHHDAMTAAEVDAAIGAGAAVTRTAVRDGADLVLLGEMGMANTTSSACLVAALTGARADDVTGRGAGASDEVYVRKVDVVAEAVRRCTGLAPLEILAAVGGFEHAALVGAMLAAARHRVPVVLDGVITNAAALIAVALQPRLGGYLIASHVSAEPGAQIALGALGLNPLLDLGLRLGEGSGALLAAPLVTAAAAVLARTARISELT